MWESDERMDEKEGVLRYEYNNIYWGFLLLCARDRFQVRSMIIFIHLFIESLCTYIVYILKVVVLLFYYLLSKINSER